MSTRRLERFKRTASVLATLLLVPMTSQAQPELNKYKVPVVSLTGRALGDESEFARPANITFVEGKLVVLDRRTDRMIHVLDAQTGRSLSQFGRRGSGPGEFLAPWELLRSASPREYWIFDTSNRRVTRVNEQLDFIEGRFAPKRMIQLEGGQELNSLQWTNDGRILCSGFLRNSLFVVFDSAGRQAAALGKFEFGDSRIPIFARQQAFTSKIALDPSKKRIALVTAYSDRLNFYTVDGKLIGEAERPFGFEPIFQVTGKGDDRFAAFTNESRDAYTSVEATESHVYALFSGRRSGDYKSESGFARQVHVFSWTGRLLSVLSLDADVLEFAIDPSEHQLFAVRHDPVPQVVSYKIPEQLRTTK